MVATTPKEIRIKDIRDMTFLIQEGFNGTSAVDDASINADDDTLGVDTHVLRDERTIVPVGARFTTAGIATVRTVCETQNSTVYSLDLTTPTGGTFTVTHGGNTTSALAFDITASAFEAALEGLASIGAGNVSVVETTGVYTITFQGTLKNTAQTITVDGSSLVAVDSHVLTQPQDGTTTWEVKFLPALVAGSLPSDDDVITWYPRRVEFEVETGDFQWTEGANPIIRKPRGVIKGLRRGEEQEMTISTAFAFSWMRASDPTIFNHITPYEALHRDGFASDWMPSSHGGVCEPYSVDLVIIDRPDCGSENAEVFIFPQFAFNSINPVVQDGIVNFGGVSAATKPIIKRPANNDDAINIIF